MIKQLTIGILLVFVVCASAETQDTRAAARDLVKKWQDAIVNVRVVVKTRMSMGGREVQSSDDTIEVVGTVIDPGGLTVVSLSSINPGPMMTKLMAGSSGSGQNVGQFGANRSSPGSLRGCGSPI